MNTPTREALVAAGWKVAPATIEAPDGQHLDRGDLVAVFADGSRSYDLREGVLLTGAMLARMMEGAADD